MVERQPFTEIRRSTAPALLAAAIVMLIVSAAGAADRVVLGEYFTNHLLNVVYDHGSRGRADRRMTTRIDSPPSPCTSTVTPMTIPWGQNRLDVFYGVAGATPTFMVDALWNCQPSDYRYYVEQQLAQPTDVTLELSGSQVGGEHLGRHGAGLPRGLGAPDRCGSSSPPPSTITPICQSYSTKRAHAGGLRDRHHLLGRRLRGRDHPDHLRFDEHGQRLGHRHHRLGPEAGRERAPTDRVPGGHHALALPRRIPADHHRGHTRRCRP